jgi:signal transduction histidine kinase
LVDTDGVSPAFGEIKVRVSTWKSKDPVPMPNISIEISDNGAATISDDVREAFRKKWETARRACVETSLSTHSQFGLVFVHTIVRGHGGQLNLLTDNDYTTVQILLPMFHQPNPISTK